MSIFDPNFPETSSIAVFTEELSVEDVAQLDVLEEVEEESIEGAQEEMEDTETTEARPVRPIPSKPIPPVRLIKRMVSGSYESCPKPWRLDLRVDVDGYRPMRRVSGDYYHVSGRTVSYFGSFIINAPKIRVSSSQVTITGLADTTWKTSYNKIRVVIPRHTIFQPPANAYVQWMTSANKRGASYICIYKSRYFRIVDLEQDHEKGVKPFVSYNTGSLPSGGPARTLTVERAYAEAGVQMRNSGFSNEVPVAPGGTWSNAELHNAMEIHFKRWKDVPQWKVWLFHANAHEYGPGLLGIMFDQKGKQRQGCAVFYQRIAGTSAVNLRYQLYVCVHELGHCFNLFHSFHKKYMKPPRPNRLDALSWMNYPWKYPGGAAAFWSAFPFQFDDLEVIHLRHAFRNNIIMGGNPFGTGAALEDPEALADNVDDNSGLNLKLETKKSFALGEPVFIEIKLYATDMRGKEVHKHLHPDFGFVQIAIQLPSGEVVVYSPPIEHCVEVETTTLDENNPSIYESAYIGYDKTRGLLFSQPGLYKLRGIYYALDGSVVLSDITSLRIRAPLSSVEEEIADLLLGDEQGMLFYLLGSDSESLSKGNEALDLLIDKYSDNPLSVYAQWIKGINASREFKHVTTDYQIEVREPEYDKADKLLSAVIEASEAEKGLDNITLNKTMRCKARTDIAAGKRKEAEETLKRMEDIFAKKDLKPHVMNTIKEQVEEIKKEM
ncbi:MAG: hypothetical protein D6828_02340 [Nitrospirae bacterium]|nr:MAG: hypothetical protein D6828_02340 [Nitrospirota bacterium]